MNSFLLILGAIILAAICLLPLAARHSRGLRRAAFVVAINTLPGNLGTSEKSRRYLASAAVATRYLLAKIGADDQHAAAVAAASDEPIGCFTDEAAAAEDPLNVELFGVTNRTLVLVAKVAITLGADVYSDGTGKVTIKPTAAGTYWKVGKALTASGADNDPIEVAVQKPRKLIVIAALTSTNGTAAAASASLANLAAEAEKIGDDVRAIAAALDGSADVALATT